MKRREFIGLVGGAAVAWPLALRAQQRAIPVIGFLNAVSPYEFADRLRGFHRGLKETGYVEGENVAIEFRWAEDQLDRLPVLAAELVRRQVAVIVSGAGPTVPFAAKAATTTIPIVFLTAEDPVRLGLVASLARQGANLTGINFFTNELVAKRLELLRELVPGATRVAVLANPIDAQSTESTLRDVEAVVHAMGLQIQVLKASTSSEISAAFATFVREPPDAVFVSAVPFTPCPIDPLGDLSQGALDSWIASLCRSRGADELWSEPNGRVSPGWDLCRSHPQEARGRPTCQWFSQPNSSWSSTLTVPRQAANPNCTRPPDNQDRAHAERQPCGRRFSPTFRG